MLDAATRGTTDGIKLALNVGGMLLAFTGLVYLLNWMVSAGVGEWSGWNSWVVSVTDGRFEAFNFSFLVGIVSAPFAWLIGVAWEDCLIVGQLLGERLVLNEFISYLNLAEFEASEVFRDPRSAVIATYALCGFANLTSVEFKLAGSAPEPSQRPNLLKFGLRSL